MLWKEFEELANVEISYKDYSEKIEPMYMATDMSKQDFVSFILPSAKAMAKAYKEEQEKANEKKVFISDGTITPNGCYVVGRWMILKRTEINIRTGKKTYVLREMLGREREENGWDIDRAYWDDISIWYDKDDKKTCYKIA